MDFIARNHSIPSGEEMKRNNEEEYSFDSFAPQNILQLTVDIPSHEGNC
jgi:hypothetical protein